MRVPVRAPAVAARADARFGLYVSVLALSGALAPMRDSCLWADDCDVSDGNTGAANASCQSFCARCGQPQMFPSLGFVCVFGLAFRYSADEDHPRGGACWWVH